MKRTALTDAAIRALIGAIQLLQDDVHEKRPVCTALLCARRERLAPFLSNAFVLFDPPVSLADAQLPRSSWRR